MISLRRLHHALVLLEEQQFARAATRVHLSQPAFSRSIQTLEEEVGASLFDRQGQAVTPSQVGEFLLPRAAQLVAQARQLEEDVSQYMGGQTGHIRFGIGPVVANTLLSGLLGSIRKRFPAVQICVEQGASSQLLDSLTAREIDFFIAELRSVPRSPQFKQTQLMQADLCFIARAAHPLAGRPCNLAEVWGHGVGAVGFGEGARKRVAAALQCDPQAVFLSVLCNSHLSLVDLVRQSDTVLISTRESVQDALESASLVVLNVSPPLPMAVEFGVVSLAGRSLSPIATQVMQGLPDLVEGLASDKA